MLVLGAIAFVGLTAATAPTALADDGGPTGLDVTVEGDQRPEDCQQLPPNPEDPEDESRFCVVYEVDEGDAGFEDQGACIVNFCFTYPRPYVDEGPQLTVEVWDGDEQVLAVSVP